MSDLEAISGDDSSVSGTGAGSATPAEAPVNILSQNQLAALAALTNGGNFNHAAAAAGVNRSTLYRWTRADAAFRAAYNAWQAEARESARARLMTAADKAVDKVIDCLNHDYKFAFSVIKELGLLRHRPDGETDPRRVRQEIEVEVKELDHRLTSRLAALTDGAAPPGFPPRISFVQNVLACDRPRGDAPPAVPGEQCTILSDGASNGDA